MNKILDIKNLDVSFTSQYGTIHAVKDISIKATTTERLGFVGKEKGIAAYATVLINKVGVS